MKITKETGIIEALEMNPNAAEILIEEGMGCVGCMAASFENLEQGCLAHGMDERQINKIIDRLNKK